MPLAFDPLVQDEPYAAYRELRARAPVYRNEARGFWALSRFNLVQPASAPPVNAQPTTQA